jgi:hypothetical protein
MRVGRIRFVFKLAVSRRHTKLRGWLGTLRASIDASDDQAKARSNPQPEKEY